MNWNWFRLIHSSLRLFRWAYKPNKPYLCGIVNKQTDMNEHEWTNQKVCGKSIHRLVALRPSRGRLRLCPNTWPPLCWHSAIRELTVATALRHLLLFCRQHCYRFKSERLTQMRVAILPRPQKGRTCFCMLHSRFQQAPFLAWQWADC